MYDGTVIILIQEGKDGNRSKTWAEQYESQQGKIIGNISVWGLWLSFPESKCPRYPWQISYTACISHLPFLGQLYSFLQLFFKDISLTFTTFWGAYFNL